jgi:hypothetical protein
MGQVYSIFVFGPKKISDNEQRFFVALGVFAPLYIIHLMRDTFNDSYPKKVLASTILLLVFYIFLHLSILNYIGCDVVKTLIVIFPKIFYNSFAMALWSLFYFYVGLQKNINTIAVYSSILVWNWFVVSVVLYACSGPELCPDV